MRFLCCLECCSNVTRLVKMKTEKEGIEDVVVGKVRIEVEN